MHKTCYLVIAAGIAAAFTCPPMVAPGHAQSATTNPGFGANSGQINTGSEPSPSSQSNAVSNIPSPEKARAALLAPISRQPSTGDTPASTTGTGGQSTPNAASEPPPSGPISSFGQTIPAKFSERNDTLDHVPIMAWPLRLDDAQLKSIYDAIMADKSQPVAGAETLKPASELSPDQALHGMHPLPQSVNGIDGVRGLYFVKGKNKALLVDGPTRTVVAEIQG